jgi:predicted phosphoadenosine phosphosulfate sulfurtransferase
MAWRELYIRFLDYEAVFRVTIETIKALATENTEVAEIF